MTAAADVNVWRLSSRPPCAGWYERRAYTLHGHDTPVVRHYWNGSNWHVSDRPRDWDGKFCPQNGFEWRPIEVHRAADNHLSRRTAPTVEHPPTPAADALLAAHQAFFSRPVP